MNYNYFLYELVGARFLQEIFTKSPIQLHDFIEIGGRLLQVKQISHEITNPGGHEGKVKLFAIIISGNEKANRS